MGEKRFEAAGINGERGGTTVAADDFRVIFISAIGCFCGIYRFYSGYSWLSILFLRDIPPHFLNALSNMNSEPLLPRKDESPTTVTIREMELRDLPQVFALGEQLFKAEKWPTLYRAWDEYEIVDLFGSDGQFCLVAENGRGVVAFALGALMEKSRSAWRYGWVLWMGISTDYQGRGIGRRLLNNLTELFIEHDARMMLVDTDAHNTEALEFFRNQGFGNEIQHTYLSKNFDEHPSYRERRAAKRRAQARKRKRAVGSRIERGRSHGK